jgi:hypothetical protein
MDFAHNAGNEKIFGFITKQFWRLPAFIVSLNS